MWSDFTHHAGQLEAQAHDGEGMESDRREDRHLHGGDEPEFFEQEIREGDECVLRGRPCLHEPEL